MNSFFFELKGKLKLGHHRSWWISCVHLKYPWRSNYSTIFESSTYIFHHHPPRSFICLSLFLSYLVYTYKIFFWHMKLPDAKCLGLKKLPKERSFHFLKLVSGVCSSKYNPSELKCYKNWLTIRKFHSGIVILLVEII